MAIKDPNFYNQSSAKSLGWTPQWFNCELFDDDLVVAIKKFQKEHKLEADGLCGSQTFKSINNERQMHLAIWQKQNEEKEKQLVKKNVIICGEKQFEIPWNKFVGLVAKGALVASPEHYRSRNGKEIKMIVVHNDACLHSQDCHKVLERRGLSISFMIDYDGTIYQSVDLLKSAQQAGSVNSFSVGIEVCNPIELKYNSYYTNKKLNPRPIVKEWISNGKKYKNFLGYYEDQIEALKVLLKTLCENLNIPKIAAPTHNFYEPAFSGEFKGIVGHYHVDPKKQKWDAAGLELVDLVGKI